VEDQGQAVAPEPAWLEDWAEYAKDRYESARSGIIEFRGWARQLLAALAVVIGLEVNFLVRLLDVATSWMFAPIGWLFVTIVYQMLVARRIIPLGYGSVWGAEVPVAPQQMAHRLRGGRNTAPSRQLIGDQYAQAYLARRTVSKEISAALVAETHRVVRSLLLGLTVAIVGAIAVSFLTPERSRHGVEMRSGRE
jgi:hypothetical protein